MSLQGDSQVRNVFVSKGIATGATTLELFIKNATEGQVGVYKEDGTAAPAPAFKNVTAA